MGTGPREDADPPLAALRRELAEARVDARVLDDARRRLEEAERAGGRVPALEADLDRSQRRLAAAEQEVARLAPIAARVPELEERLARGERALEDIKSSPSWRVTRPLRALKRLAR